MEEARNLAFKCIDEGRAASIATANAEMVMRAQTDRELAHILQHADLVVPDGAGVLWAAEQQGKKFKERVTGVDLACSLLQEAAARQTAVYLFGGAPGIAEQAAANVQQQLGSLNIVGTHSGFFSADEEQGTELSGSKFTILLVEDRVKTGATVKFAIDLLQGAKQIKTFAVNGNAYYALYNEDCFMFPWILPSGR